MKKFIKKNIKIILGFALGLIWSSGIAYAATILFDSDEVSYDNTTSGLSATNVQSALDELYVESTSYQLFESRVSSIENKLYPVGSIYLSITITSASDVGTLLGGTWEAISEGRVLIGAGTGTDSNSTLQTFSVNSTGGEYTHKLTTNEMPSHSHNEFLRGMYHGGSYQTNYMAVIPGYWDWTGQRANTSDGTSTGRSATGSMGVNTGSAGSNYYHNNIQPYLVVYIYKRTA